MSVEDHTLIDTPQRPASIRFEPPVATRERLRLRLRRGRRSRAKPRLRKLRFLLVLIAFLILAGTSMLFGILTAIASDLPQLIPKAPSTSVDSYLYDYTGQPIGVLAPPTQPVLDTWKQISPNMVHAIIAVEDKRFWTDPGIDIRGLVRAALNDITGGPTQGASTIAEQFVKVKLAQENNRTIFEKLREAGLAFQLVHHWKRTRILTDYLNTIYFGNGANGIEAAARVYFGWAHGYQPANPGGESRKGCGSPDVQDPNRVACAQVLTPAQAALLAGMVANPYAFDPVLHPQAAIARRNQVLILMYQQHYLTRSQYEYAISRPVPTAAEIQQPQEPQAAPYFTSWVRPLIIHALMQEGLTRKQAEYQAYYGKLNIHLTLDLKLQQAAQQAVNQIFPPGSKGPSASLVAIDNRTGEVRAMVSGDGNYNAEPFNLATLGYRQPGSAFKLFTLAAALQSGRYTPQSVFDSKPLDVPFRTRTGYLAHFVVHNFGNEYLGPTTLTTATAVSDNSVFTQLGMAVGLKNIAHYAREMGIRSPISTTPAMILGGLSTGVSALDLAHAYQTEANGGVKLYNTVLGDYDQGPVGISSISGCVPCAQHTITNSHPNQLRVVSPQVAAEIHSLLHGPVDDPAGTGTNAAIPGIDVAGKTGTTNNFVDAWFAGFTPQLTVAVWVGYPNSGQPMDKNFHGGPVEGGTFPAIIWRNFMVNALQILANEQAAAAHRTAPNLGLQPTTYARTTSTPSTTVQPSGTSGKGAGTTQTAGAGRHQGSGHGTGAGHSPAGGGAGSGGSTPAGTQPTQPAGSTGTGQGSPTANGSQLGGLNQVTTTTPVSPPPTSPTTTTPTAANGGNGL